MTTSPALALLAAILAFAPPAIAQRAAIRTDSVLFVGDLNGNGKTDYVVRESKSGSFDEVRASRISVYLDSRAESRRPAWSTRWDDAGEMDRSIDPPRTLAPGVSVVEVIESGGDWDGETMLVVQPSGIRKELEFGVDYGNGEMSVNQMKNATYIIATDAHLSLRGKTLESHLKCRNTEWSAMRLDYNPKLRKFVAGRGLCVPMPGPASTKH